MADIFPAVTILFKAHGYIVCIILHKKIQPCAEKNWSQYHMKVTNKICHFAEIEKCQMDGNKSAFLAKQRSLKAIAV